MSKPPLSEWEVMGSNPTAGVSRIGYFLGGWSIDTGNYEHPYFYFKMSLVNIFEVALFGPHFAKLNFRNNDGYSLSRVF